MKAMLLVSNVVMVSLMGGLFSAQASAATAQDLANQAQSSYAQRSFDHAGEMKAREAADLYAQAAAAATDKVAKANYLNGQAEALYFVGGANDDKGVKKDIYMKGIDAAGQGAALFGVTDVRNVSDAQKAQLKALPAATLAVAARAIYLRGINLGQWGQANGISESLGKWPELKDNMQLVIDLGYASIAEYGPYRTLGRGYFKVPGLLGGSKKKAEQYLTAATSKTLAKDASGKALTYSVNGTNNTFLAELLHDASKGQPEAMLQDFIKADPATLLPGQEVETKQAQLEAQDLLKSW